MPQGEVVTIRVVLAEDQRLVREALAAVLALDAELRLVGTAATGREAISVTQAKRPDALVLDIGLPEMSGVLVAQALHRQMPGLRIVALSIHDEEHYVQEMLRAGALAYVDKYSALADLGRAVRAAMQGRIYLSPHLAHEAPPVLRRADEPITERERQVLVLLADGKRSRDIASELGVSPQTVEVHRRNLMRKLALHSVAELTRYAVRSGLINP
jgi:DNA-binding NarL/FixJ family response regulator